MISRNGTLSRRAFIGSCAAVASSVSLFAAEPPKRFQQIGFIKPIQKLPYGEIARVAREMGWDGIECPVRKGGTVEPERAEEELPKVADALKREGMLLSVIATNILDANDRVSQSVLRTARALHVSRYRTGYLHYDLSKPIVPQLESFRPRLRDLAQLNREIGIQGGMQNHSGRNYFGAPLWDLWEVVRDLDPRHLGIYFDIGHATVESGVSWGIQAKLVEPHLVTVSVKDFVWAKRKENWRHEWCQLGEGKVKQDYFKSLRESSFAGPICHHFEFPLGEGEEKIASMKRESETLRRWLEAGVSEF